jgi:uncharacterized damage-inducible protein DinB
MIEPVLDVWRIHDAVHRQLLDEVPDKGLEAIPLLKNGQPGKGRGVARVFLHLYDVRLSFLRAADKKAFLSRVPAFERGATPTRQEIEAFMAASGRAVGARLADAIERNDTIHKRHPLVWLGYLICHESHHRGQMLLALKQNGFAPSEMLRWGIWGRWFKD